MSKHDEIKAIINKWAWAPAKDLDDSVDEIEKLFPAPGWKDVREELPSDNDAYIVYDKEGSRGMAAYCGNGQWGGWRDVTHWMPLPSPPEGVQR